MAESFAAVATAAMRWMVSSMAWGPWLQLAPTAWTPHPSRVRTASSGVSP